VSIQTYQVDDGWVVSVNEQWVPGVYDSDETARSACVFSDVQLKALVSIWNHKGENRPATMADLARIPAAN
jgi:hypothetical protein